MSLHYLGKHEPGNCVFSVRHRHVSSPGECGHGCVQFLHAGRPEVVTLNICYNWPVLFRATHIIQEYWKDTISGFMFRLPELTQNRIRSPHGHSTPLKISCKSVQPFSRNVADKETNKEINKERNKKRNKSSENNTPSPFRGRGNNCSRM